MKLRDKLNRLAIAGTLGLAGLVNSGCGEIIAGALIADSMDQQTKEMARARRQAQQPQLPYAFSCNYYQDFNGDGFATPDEFVGMKNRFSTDEKITLVLNNGIPTEHIVSWDIFDKNQNKVQTFSVKKLSSEYGRFAFDLNKQNELSPGNYVALWKVNDKPVATYQFEICEKPAPTVQLSVKTSQTQPAN